MGFSKHFALAVAVVGVLGAVPARATPIAQLTLTSQPGDFVGQGESFDITYTPADEFFSATAISFVASKPSFLRFILGTISGAGNTFSTLDFSTSQLGIPIGLGVFDNAERASFASPGHPGLDVGFQNRGCDTITGNFTVTEAEFTGNTIDAFSASFVQHCEGFTPALFGTFSYSATAPSAVPEPGTLGVFATGLAGLALLRRRRSSINPG